MVPKFTLNSCRQAFVYRTAVVEAEDAEAAFKMAYDIDEWAMDKIDFDDGSDTVLEVFDADGVTVMPAQDM